jgi:DNA-binding Xre family transcriptional regulator
MVDFAMPIRWKFPQYLQAHNVSVYALAQELEGKVTITTLYNLKNKPQKRIDLENLEAVIHGLERLTGKRVDITDLLELDRVRPRGSDHG